MSASIEQRNQDSTCWIGNLDERVSEDVLWELFSQCGPVVGVHMPRVSQQCLVSCHAMLTMISQQNYNHDKLFICLTKNPLPHF